MGNVSICRCCDKDINFCYQCRKELDKQIICVFLNLYNQAEKINNFHFCCISCYEEFKNKTIQGIITEKIDY